MEPSQHQTVMNTGHTQYSIWDVMMTWKIQGIKLLVVMAADDHAALRWCCVQKYISLAAVNPVHRTGWIEKDTS